MLMSPKLKALAASAALSLGLHTWLVQAQDDSAGAAADGGASSGEETAAPAAPVKPRPSELLVRAPLRTALDMVNTGKHLVAVGERGHILVSNNGVDWAQVAVPVRATLTALTFIDEQNGWAVGHDATILHTTDGGKTWRLQNFEPEKEQAFLDVLFVDAQNGYAVGAFGLFYGTTDGGDNWAEVEAPAVREEELYFHSIAKLGDGSLLVAGETGMLGVSTPDRASFKRLTSPYEGTFFGALPYKDKGAIVFGLRGNVYVSDDVNAGNWQKVETKTIASFFGGSLLADGRALLVGSSGAAYVIDPAAKTAEAIATGLSFSLTSGLQFKNGVLVSGERGPHLIAAQLN
jgi:photosystem II stability/assembly factor-like uncharacterized protein